MVVQFLRQAAADPDVVAIKQTLYRTSHDSPDRQRADRGGGSRQVGHRAGRAQGPLRRGRQHQMGARPGTRRRAGGLWLHRAQDPRQGQPGGAPRERAAAHLCAISAPATIIRQTAKIYTDLSLFSADPALGRDAAQLFNFITGYAEPSALEKIAISPLTLRGRLIDGIQQEIMHARAGRPGRDLGQAEFAGRSRHDRRALPRQPGRRADRTGRARHLLPAPRRAGPVGEYPGQEHRRPLPGTWPHRLLRQRPRPAVAEMPRSTSPRPTGCRATSTAASKRWFRSKIPPSINRCWTRSWWRC